jgi:hypothetical protein
VGVILTRPLEQSVGQVVPPLAALARIPFDPSAN